MTPSPIRSSFLVALCLSGLALAGCGAPVQSEGTGALIETPVSPGTAQKPVAAQADGKFSRWLVSPTGKVSGMLLEDGSIVRVHARDLDTTKLQKGDAVRVDGLAVEKDSRKVYMFAGVQKGTEAIVEKPEGKAHHEDWKKHDGKKHDGKKHDGKKHDGKKHDGWKKHHADELSKLESLSVSGTIADILPGRHGVTLLLSDGSLVSLPNDAMVTVKKGDAVKATGKGGTYPAGKALFAATLEGPTGNVQTL